MASENKLFLDYDYFWEEFGTSGVGIYALNGRDIAILLSAIKYASWPSRWTDSGGYLLRAQGRTNDLLSAVEYIEQLENRLMTDFTSEIGAGLQAIANAIASKNCGCVVNCYCGGSGSGTGGAGQSSEPPAGEYDQEGEPPGGYESWQEYHTDVCAKATWLLSTIQTDLQNYSLVQWGGATLVATVPIILALTLDPIPGDEIFLLVGILIAIAAYGSTTLTTVKGSFIDGYGDMLCALYNANGSEAGKEAALAAFRSQIEGDTSDPIVVEYGVQVVGIMLSWDGLNRVYTKQEGVSYPPGDCSECGEGEPYFIRVDVGTEIGRGEDDIGAYIDVQMVAAYGNYYANLSAWTDETATVPYGIAGMVQRVSGAIDGGGSGTSLNGSSFSFTATAGPFYVPPSDPAGWKDISIGNVAQVDTVWRFYLPPITYP